MMISNDLLDELLKGWARPEDLPGEAGLMKELKIRLMERMVSAGLTAHLGYEAGAARAAAGGAARGEESEAIAAEGGHDGGVWWGFGGVSRSGRFGKV